MKISEGHYPSDTSLAVKTSHWEEINLIESWCDLYADSHYPEFHKDYVWIHIWFKTPSDKTLFVLRFGS